MSNNTTWKKAFSEFNKDELQMPFIIGENFNRLQGEAFLEQSETQEFRDKEGGKDVNLNKGFDVQALETPTPEVGDD